MIKFYHKAGCPLCKVAQMKLDKKEVPYIDILVDTDNLEDENFKYLLEKGIKQMPILIVDGEIIGGADVAKWANSYGGAQ